MAVYAGFAADFVLNYIFFPPSPMLVLLHHSFSLTLCSQKTQPPLLNIYLIEQCCTDTYIYLEAGIDSDGFALQYVNKF